MALFWGEGKFFVSLGKFLKGNCESMEERGEIIRELDLRGKIIKD